MPCPTCRRIVWAFLLFLIQLKVLHSTRRACPDSRWHGPWKDPAGHRCHVLLPIRLALARGLSILCQTHLGWGKGREAGGEQDMTNGPCYNVTMFHAIWEFAQSADCARQSENPQIGSQSADCYAICRLVEQRLAWVQWARNKCTCKPTYNLSK